MDNKKILNASSSINHNNTKENNSEMNNNTNNPDNKVSDSNINEIEIWKKKCEILEKDLFKARTQNKKHEQTITKLQERISIFGKSSNNTSNSFLLPSEFKVQWEQMVKVSLIEAFDLASENAEVLALLAQWSIEIVYKLSSNLLADTLIKQLDGMNIEVDSKNQSIEVKRQNAIRQYLPKLRNIFQEFYSNIFICNEDFINKAREELMTKVNQITKLSFQNSLHLNEKDLVKLYIIDKIELESSKNDAKKEENDCDLNNLNTSDTEILNKSIFDNAAKYYHTEKENLIELIVEKVSEMKDDIKEDISSMYFNNYIETTFKLCIYILLHEPEILLHPIEVPSYKVFNKAEYLSIEGFNKESSPCCIILNPPLLKNKFTYQGLLPAVYMLRTQSEFIVKYCKLTSEFINKEKVQKKRSKTPDVNKNELDEFEFNNNSNNSNILNKALISETGKIELESDSKQLKISVKKVNSFSSKCSKGKDDSIINSLLISKGKDALNNSNLKVNKMSTYDQKNVEQDSQVKGIRNIKFGFDTFNASKNKDSTEFNEDLKQRSFKFNNNCSDVNKDQEQYTKSSVKQSSNNEIFNSSQTSKFNQEIKESASNSIRSINNINNNTHLPKNLEENKGTISNKHSSKNAEYKEYKDIQSIKQQYLMENKNKTSNNKDKQGLENVNNNNNNVNYHKVTLVATNNIKSFQQYIPNKIKEKTISEFNNGKSGCSINAKPKSLTASNNNSVSIGSNKLSSQSYINTSSIIHGSSNLTNKHSPNTKQTNTQTHNLRNIRSNISNNSSNQQVNNSFVATVKHMNSHNVNNVNINNNSNSGLVENSDTIEDNNKKEHYNSNILQKNENEILDKGNFFTNQKFNQRITNNNANNASNTSSNDNKKEFNFQKEIKFSTFREDFHDIELNSKDLCISNSNKKSKVLNNYNQENQPFCLGEFPGSNFKNKENEYLSSYLNSIENSKEQNAVKKISDENNNEREFYNQLDKHNQQNKLTSQIKDNYEHEHKDSITPIKFKDLGTKTKKEHGINNINVNNYITNNKANANTNTNTNTNTNNKDILGKKSSEIIFNPLLKDNKLHNNNNNSSSNNNNNSNLNSNREYLSQLSYIEVNNNYNNNNHGLERSIENTKLVNFYHTPIVRSNKNNKNSNNVPISANFNLSTTPEHFSQKLDLTRKSSVKSPAEMNNNINNTNIGDSIQNIQNTSKKDFRSNSQNFFDKIVTKQIHKPTNNSKETYFYSFTNNVPYGFAFSGNQFNSSNSNSKINYSNKNNYDDGNYISENNKDYGLFLLSNNYTHKEQEKSIRPLLKTTETENEDEENDEDYNNIIREVENITSTAKINNEREENNYNFPIKQINKANNNKELNLINSARTQGSQSKENTEFLNTKIKPFTVKNTELSDLNNKNKNFEEKNDKNDKAENNNKQKAMNNYIQTNSFVNPSSSVLESQKSKEFQNTQLRGKSSNKVLDSNKRPAKSIQQNKQNINTNNNTNNQVNNIDASEQLKQGLSSFPSKGKFISSSTSLKGNSNTSTNSNKNNSHFNINSNTNTNKNVNSNSNTNANKSKGGINMPFSKNTQKTIHIQNNQLGIYSQNKVLFRKTTEESQSPSQENNEPPNNQNYNYNKTSNFVRPNETISFSKELESLISRPESFIKNQLTHIGAEVDIVDREGVNNKHATSSNLSNYMSNSNIGGNYKTKSGLTRKPSQQSTNCKHSNSIKQLNSNSNTNNNSSKTNAVKKSNNNENKCNNINKNLNAGSGQVSNRLLKDTRQKMLNDRIIVNEHEVKKELNEESENFNRLTKTKSSNLFASSKRKQSEGNNNNNTNESNIFRNASDKKFTKNDNFNTNSNEKSMNNGENQRLLTDTDLYDFQDKNQEKTLFKKEEFKLGDNNNNKFIIQSSNILSKKTNEETNKEQGNIDIESNEVNRSYNLVKRKFLTESNEYSGGVKDKKDKKDQLEERIINCIDVEKSDVHVVKQENIHNFSSNYKFQSGSISPKNSSLKQNIIRNKFDTINKANKFQESFNSIMKSDGNSNCIQSNKVSNLNELNASNFGKEIETSSYNKPVTNAFSNSSFSHPSYVSLVNQENKKSNNNINNNINNNNRKINNSAAQGLNIIRHDLSLHDNQIRNVENSDQYIVDKFYNKNSPKNSNFIAKISEKFGDSLINKENVQSYRNIVNKDFTAHQCQVSSTPNNSNIIYSRNRDLDSYSKISSNNHSHEMLNNHIILNKKQETIENSKTNSKLIESSYNPLSSLSPKNEIENKGNLNSKSPLSNYITKPIPPTSNSGKENTFINHKKFDGEFSNTLQLDKCVNNESKAFEIRNKIEKYYSKVVSNTSVTQGNSSTLNNNSNNNSKLVSYLNKEAVKQNPDLKIGMNINKDYKVPNYVKDKKTGNLMNFTNNTNK